MSYGERRRSRDRFVMRANLASAAIYFVLYCVFNWPDWAGCLFVPVGLVCCTVAIAIAERRWPYDLHKDGRWE